MESSPDLELRTAVAAGLDRLNRDHGGRFLGRLAGLLGVHRSTVSRWASAATAPTFERCLALADRYPTYFDRGLLIDLHQRIALGIEAPSRVSLSTVRPLGADVTSFVDALADALEREPVDPQAREVLHVSLEPEYEPLPNNPLFERDSDSVAMRRYLELLTRRAREGWRIRRVTNASQPLRTARVEWSARILEGPDVEIRVYPMPVPLVISMFLIARRDVFIGYDIGRLGLPMLSMLHFESPEMLTWATRYFDALLDAAPLQLRTGQGLSADDLDRLRHYVGLPENTP